MSLLMDALKKAQEAKTKVQDGGEGDTAVMDADPNSVTAAIDDAEFESFLEKKQPALLADGDEASAPAASVDSAAIEPAADSGGLEFSLALEETAGESASADETTERSVVKPYSPKEDLGLKLDESDAPLAATTPASGLTAAIADDVLSDLEKDLAKQPASPAAAAPQPEPAPAPKTEPAAKASEPALAPAAPKVAEKPADKSSPTPQAEPAKPAKEHPRQAARILSASGKAPRRTTWIRTALLGGGTLLLVAGVGGAYFYSEYQKLMAPTSQVPPPLARPALEPAQPVSEEDGADPTAFADAQNVIHAEEDAAPNPVAGDLPQAATPSRPATDTPASTRAEAVQQPAVSAPTAKAVTPKPEPQEQTVAATDAPAAAARTSSPVSIKREEPKEDVVFRELSAAYSAYQDGDFARASESYRGVLQTIPENRDALLGLAAISQKQGRPDEARGLYQRVLHLNKHDSVALAGWYGTMGEGDPLAMESELKVLLAREGNVAYLQFALGNAYARQQKWSLAEQAFSTALSLEPGSADYAYNLAVAHDQLGRRTEAARYYELALSLDRGNATYDREQVNRRIQHLRASP